MHEAKPWMFEVKVEMQTLAPLQMQLQLFGLSIASQGIRTTRLDTAQYANEPLLNTIALSDAPRHLFFALRRRTDIDQRPTRLGRQRLRGLLDAPASGFDQAAKLLKQNVLDRQISLHDRRTVKLAQGPAQAQAIKPMKNPTDTILITLYKTIGSAIAGCRLSFHTSSLTVGRWRFRFFSKPATLHL
jgi:hypothetical protein